MEKEKYTEAENFRLLQAAVQKAQDMIFIKNKDLAYVAVSDPFARMVGKPVREILGKDDYQIFENSLLADKYRADDRRILEGGNNMYEMIEPLPEVQGSTQYASTTKELLVDDNGDILGIMGRSRDLGALQAARQHFWTSIHNVLDLAPGDCYVMVADVDEWKVLERRISLQCPLPISDEMDLDVILMEAREWVDPTEKAYWFYNHFSKEHLDSLYRSGKSRILLEYPHPCPGREPIWMQDVVYLRSNPENGHLYAVILIRSLEAQRQKNLQLRQEAETDGLTGLLNRQYFIRKCSAYLEGNGIQGQHAFMMIDVDDFKSINDTYGHQRGDGVLVALARILCTSLRSEDLIGRLGGDEFVVLMKNVTDISIVHHRARDLLMKAQNLGGELDGPRPSISMGISLYPTDGTNVESLYANADIALYKAKKNHKNRCEYFNPDTADTVSMEL